MRKLALLLVLLMVGTLSSCDLIPGLFASEGTVTGVVIDVDTSSPIAGVRVLVVESGESTTTDADGAFSIKAPEGVATLRFTKTGYMFGDIIVTVVKDLEIEVTEAIVGYAPLATDEIRIVLSWGENPRDLDSHLYVPVANDEVYFNNETAADDSANLDWDDTDGYGPETITITTRNAGVYHYFVYLYAGDGTIADSGAVVKVYTTSGLFRTYYASEANGNTADRYWQVFDMNGSTFTEINEFATVGM